MKKNLSVLLCLLQVVAAIANPTELYNHYRHIIDPVLTQVAYLASHNNGHLGTLQFSWPAVNRIMFSHTLHHASIIVTSQVRTDEIARLNEECDLLVHSSTFAARASVIRAVVAAYVNDITSAVDGRMQLSIIVNQLQQENNARRISVRRVQGA